MHVYPSELVPLIIEKWESLREKKMQRAGHSPFPPLPELKVLEEMLSTCYQVSMMREENRPVSIRLIIASPDIFPSDKGPPRGFLRLIFSTTRPFNEYELRRLSPAVDFERSLVGVEYTKEGELLIWGLINSGTRWLQSERGGAKQPNQLPDSLVVHVHGPGMLTVSCGIKNLAVLSAGKIINASTNVFQAVWMKKLFADAREELLAAHERLRTHSSMPMARIEEDFVEKLQGQMLKRIISVARMANHGGTFLIFPEDTPPGIANDEHIQLKYRFVEDEAIGRQKRLFLRIIETVTTALGDPNDPDRLVTWHDYVALRNEVIYDLEEAIYEHAQFVASLAAVDGAVVVTKNGAIGFGGMIVGSLDQVTEIALASDIEGKLVSLNKIEGSGSRHRSVYHLCNALHHAMALVVSQDGGVQLAKWRNGIVTCWDLTSTTFTEDN